MKKHTKILKKKLKICSPKFKEECGIFGTYQIAKSYETNNYVINGLSDIQHRGQESSGISYFYLELLVF